MFLLPERPGVWSVDRCDTQIAVPRWTNVRVAVAEQISVGSVGLHIRSVCRGRHQSEQAGGIAGGDGQSQC